MVGVGDGLAGLCVALVLRHVDEIALGADAGLREVSGGQQRGGQAFVVPVAHHELLVVEAHGIDGRHRDVLVSFELVEDGLDLGAALDVALVDAARDLDAAVGGGDHGVGHVHEVEVEDVEHQFLLGAGDKIDDGLLEVVGRGELAAFQQPLVAEVDFLVCVAGRAVGPLQPHRPSGVVELLELGRQLVVFDDLAERLDPLEVQGGVLAARLGLRDLAEILLDERPMRRVERQEQQHLALGHFLNMGGQVVALLQLLGNRQLVLESFLEEILHRGPGEQPARQLEHAAVFVALEADRLVDDRVGLAGVRRRALLELGQDSDGMVDRRLPLLGNLT